MLTLVEGNYKATVLLHLIPSRVSAALRSAFLRPVSGKGKLATHPRLCNTPIRRHICFTHIN